jgi:hypothetical protein
MHRVSFAETLEIVQASAGATDAQLIAAAALVLADHLGALASGVELNAPEIERALDSAGAGVVELAREIAAALAFLEAATADVPTPRKE